MQLGQNYRVFIGCLAITIFLFVIYMVYENFDNIDHIKLVYNLGEYKEYVDHYENVTDENNSIYRRKFAIPKHGANNIIFLETSCAVNATFRTCVQPRLVLDSQQSCAIESASRANPDVNIYLFYTCPLDEDSLARSSEMVRQLFDYPNVYFWHESMASFFAGTPLDEFYKSGQMKTSTYPASHSSDVLRFLSLWKFGGTYLDLDFIVRRSLAPLGSDYACAEDLDYIASGAMSFSTSGVGLELARKCVEEIRTNFRGDVWNHNGPGLITRVLKTHCGVNKTNQMTKTACHGFTTQPSTVFYPIMYKYLLFYNEANSSTTMASIEPSYAVHLWHSLVIFRGGDISIRKESKQPIVLLLKRFCPVAYLHTNEPP